MYIGSSESMEYTAAPRDAASYVNVLQPCAQTHILGSKAQRRRLRDRKVAIRHALCHTSKLKKNIGEVVKLPDTFVEDCFVSESLERSSAKNVTGRGRRQNDIYCNIYTVPG